MQLMRESISFLISLSAVMHRIAEGKKTVLDLVGQALGTARKSGYIIY